jgi:hypothetical protein
MSHFAKVVDGIVTQVIVAEPEFFDTFVDSSPGTWLQTSYNTHGNQHPRRKDPYVEIMLGLVFLTMQQTMYSLPLNHQTQQC